MKYSARKTRPGLSIDGMNMAPAIARPILVARPAVQKTASKKHIAPPQAKRRQLPYWLQILIGTPLILLAALLVQSGVFGQLAIVAYGVAAFVWRIPSRTTFTLVLISIITTTILLVGKGNLPLSQAFATYTFLLLVVGVFTLSRELKQEGGRVYSRQHRQY